MKKVFWIVFLGAIAIGLAGAQNFEFDFQNTAPNFSLSGFNTSFRPDTFAEEGGSNSAFPGSPLMAGLLNVPFGIYSWMNGDILGGVIVAGLESAALALTIVGNNINLDQKAMGIWLGAAIGGFIVAPIYGFVRGSRQYKKLNAVAWTGNPMDHITVTALPTSEGGVAGSLTFRASF
ncbi:MAG: hypothetical protein LBD96_01890 [Treponema sp.]|jgi:hypothetical protein|nr:hypothetical protein [Treponema sp.]